MAPWKDLAENGLPHQLQPGEEVIYELNFSIIFDL
jgi:hypothetical protein